ncbi:MAG: hypothetical protein ACI8R8_002326, partial [Paraglaciecola sp.]
LPKCVSVVGPISVMAVGVFFTDVTIDFTKVCVSG